MINITRRRRLYLLDNTEIELNHRPVKCCRRNKSFPVGSGFASPPSWSRRRKNKPRIQAERKIDRGSSFVIYTNVLKGSRMTKTISRKWRCLRSLWHGRTKGHYRVGEESVTTKPLIVRADGRVQFSWRTKISSFETRVQRWWAQGR